MNKRTPLVVSGLIFSLVAIAHILRLVYHWDVMIGGLNIPESVSVIGIIVTGILAIWMFSAAAKRG